MIAEIESGAVENPMMPSSEYRNRLKKLHFVWPPARSTFSYSKYLTRNPTHEKIPFEKRLYSVIDRTASTICLVIKRKSCAPSTISVCEIRFMIL